MARHLIHARVLAIDPYRRGFGFAVLEGIELIDWGLARLYSRKSEELLVRLDAMIRRYRPTLVCLEDVADDSRRTEATKRIESIVGYVALLDIPRALVSRDEIRVALGLTNRATKFQAAEAVAQSYPELAVLLPRARRPWESENEKVNVFDAVELALSAAMRH
jgi:hypothetical protein